MIRRLSLAIILTSSFLVGSHLKYNGKVVITAPVADCLTAPAQTLDRKRSVGLYEELGCAPQEGRYSCPRVHQCIFNEVCTVCEKNKKEVLIEFTHFFYITNDTTRNSRFWVKAASVTLLSELKKWGLDKAVPEPLNPNTHPQETILTLILPWQNPHTKLSYSTGTRFVHIPLFDTEKQYAIKLINFNEKRVTTAFIDREKALVQRPSCRRDTKALFVQILRKWISYNSGVIPYIWGGCSFIEHYTEKDFYLYETPRGNNTAAYWKRPHTPGQHHGFDCSNLVLRAAQAAGIHYFCKNTTTIGHLLDDIDKEELEEGDLILTKGHVYIISDLTNQKLIEAGNYSREYGCIHEASLKDTFKDITSYSDLIQHLKDGYPLLIKKNRKGDVASTYDSSRIIKLTDHT